MMIFNLLISKMGYAWGTYFIDVNQEGGGGVCQKLTQVDFCYLLLVKKKLRKVDKGGGVGG